MDPSVVESLLNAIRDAVTANRRQDDVALPTFDPVLGDNGAEPWCDNIEAIAKEFGWSSIAKVAKAGKALKGSALLWFESWDPSTGRTWENFRTEIIDLYPAKKNLSEKLFKAVTYSSDFADSYCEYAREKVRLLKHTKIAFTEAQLVELVCGSIRDVNVRMASFNSNSKTTAELLSLFTTYVKTRKRPLDNNVTESLPGPSSVKRGRVDFRANSNVAEVRCFNCHKLGHSRSQCFKNKNFINDTSQPEKNTQTESRPARFCTYCKKPGHDETVCFAKKRVTEKLPEAKDVNCFTKSVELKLTKVHLNGISVDSLIDTGASCSIIKESLARRLNCKISPCSLFLNGIGQGSLHIFALITVIVEFEGLHLELDAHVARDTDFHYDFLIGRNAVQYPDIAIVTDSAGCRITRTTEFQLENFINELSYTEVNPLDELAAGIEHLDDDLQIQVKKVFEEFPSVLPLPGSISTVKTGELKIRTKGNAEVKYRPYRLAPIERQKVNDMIKDLLEQNIIRDSDSSFASPVLLVKKKDGSDRLCIDYRALNKIMEKDSYPLPLIEDQIDKLGAANLFISIDMKNGFYQIPVADDSIKFTAFITPDGHYEFLKMPFGICNGPAVFQRAINKAVHQLKFLLVYIDDLLIPCKSIDEGLRFLKLTLEALSAAGFTINPKKCKFFVDSIEYLGRHISRDGVRPSDCKVNALVNSPVPQNIKQVRQFMGLASYFRKFVPEFASRTACITKLTKSNEPWKWGPEQDSARQYVLKHLSSKPLLTIYDPEKPTELYTDASAIGYGAILVQNVNNIRKVVAYYSKRTSPAESKYCSYDLETLAIYNALKHFRVYLLGIKFKIFTDCNSIKSTMNKRDLSPRVARWWTFLQDFQFEIVYKKGEYIKHVDFLSRNPVNCQNNTTIADINVIDEPQSWLAIAQQRDPETLSLIEQVERGEIDPNQYIVRNNLLHYKNSPSGQPKLYVPKGHRLYVTRLFHDENCHVGFEKTLHKIRENFWFPGMAAFVKKYLFHCLVCVEKKGHSGPKQGFLHPLPKNAVPFHTIHLDCTGPFIQTNDGSKHILMVIDGFTKFCILKPLKTLGAQELIPIIRETVTLFGTPSLVVTDRGTNFSSRQVRELFRELRIEHHMIATGTPRSNGQVERYVTTIINMLAAACVNTSDWPNELWKVQQTINTTVQKSTGFSPLRLLIGRNSNVPNVQASLDEVLGNNPTNEIIDVGADRELAHRRLVETANKFKQRFDETRRNNKIYNVGDLVYVSQDHRRNDKLSPKFKGPYEILEILPHDRYSLRGTQNLRNIIIAKEKLRYWPGEWVEDGGVLS